MKARNKILPLMLILLVVCPLKLMNKPAKKKAIFSLEAINAKIPYHSEWEGHALNEEETRILGIAFGQPYHYLGSGGQCFAFVSADEKYVIKFIKQKAFAIPNWLEKFPIPWMIHSIKQKKILKKEARRNKIFSTFKMSFDFLKEETGILFVHLNATQNINKALCVFDAQGKSHLLALDDLEFIVQKKCALAYSFIDSLIQKNDRESAQRAIEKLLALNVQLFQKGFRNRDSNFHTNYGFIDEEAILIDVGRMVYDNDIKKPEHFKRELQKISLSLRNYLAKHHPLLVEAYDPLRKIPLRSND